MSTYSIIRFHADPDHPDHGKVLDTGLTLEEAREHCRRDDTHGTDADGLIAWFDGYTEES